MPLSPDLTEIKSEPYGGEGVERAYVGGRKMQRFTCHFRPTYVPISQGEVADVSTGTGRVRSGGFLWLYCALIGRKHASAVKGKRHGCEGGYNCYWETKAAVVSC